MTSDERNLLRVLVNEARRTSFTTQPGCVGCGIPHDELNPGCKHCADRRRKRLRRRTAPGTQKGWCVGCQQPYYETTPGCLPCKERHRGRERYRAGKEA